MKSKRFEFFKKDLKYVKKDIIFRTIFSFLFLVIFVWQMAAIINKSLSAKLSTTQTIVSIFVLIFSLLLSLVSLSYIFKDFRIISVVKTNGKCISSVPILFQTKKRSFIWLYNLLLQILTLVISLVLIVCITYSILEFAYFSTISFFMPVLLLICVSGYNSVYHIKDEIYIQNILHEQQPLY